MSYEDRDTYGMYKSYDEKGPGPRLMGADTLMGEDVYIQRGEDLGDIKEIMLDMNNGKVAYAVLSFGGFLGMGDKLFAVPWNALTLDTENKRFILDVDKDRLESAPGFDKDDWPDMADPTWQSTIHSYYGMKAYTDADYGERKQHEKHSPDHLIPVSPSGAGRVKDRRSEAYKADTKAYEAPEDEIIPDSPSGSGIVIDKRNETYKNDTKPYKPSKERIIPVSPSGPGIVIDKRDE